MLHVLVIVLLYLLSRDNAFLVRAFPSRNWVLCARSSLYLLFYSLFSHGDEHRMHPTLIYWVQAFP